ncbi:MAG: hypothetical protein AB8B95_14625 [Pseudohongiellaceae bacterium]
MRLLYRTSLTLLTKRLEFLNISRGFLCLALGLLCTPSYGQNELRVQANQYQAQIDSLGGNYENGSSEVFLSLAGVQMQLGDYEQANHNFREAIQSLRVTQGLYSEGQLAIVKRFNEALRQQQNWEQLDSNLHLAKHMASKLFDQQDSRYVETAIDLATWKIKAYQAAIYRAGDDRSVQEAAKIYENLIQALPEGQPDSDAKRADYFAAQGLAYYYSAQYVADLDLDEFKANVPATGAQLQCYPLVMSADGPQPVRSACQGADASDPEIFAAQQRAKNDTVRRHIASMRRSFALAVDTLEKQASVSPHVMANAILRLGDAGLLAQDYVRANTQYAKAWELLSVDGESQALRDQLMGSPVQVMQDVLDDYFVSELGGNNAFHGTISFEVSSRGEIRDIGIKGSDADLVKENLGAIAIKLDQTAFRPKIELGKPVSSRLVLDVSQL